MQSFPDSPNYFWAIECESEHVGNMNAYVDADNSLADLGILIGVASARAKGIGCEAWLAICGFLFEQKNIRKITAGTLAVNIPMLGLMKKSGMRDDGRRINHYLCDGQEVDVVFMALFLRDWLAVQRG
jgi:RimJ/RimL family protein N-acetyltransferase